MIKINQMEVKRCNDRGINVLRNREGPEVPTALSLDCKTVRIFAYSSTREQSNKRSEMRLKTESETTGV